MKLIWFFRIAIHSRLIDGNDSDDSVKQKKKKKEFIFY